MQQTALLRLASASALLLAAAFPVARAQTVIDLTYSGGVCTFTTDASGVSLDSVNGHLTATNTAANAFSGQCPGGQVVNPAITQALASTVASPTEGQSFTLSWNTSNVDYCRTDGTTLPAGVSFAAWPLTAQICTGAACAPGSVALVAPTGGAGNYHFALACYRNGNSTPALTSLNMTVNPPGGGITCPTPVTGSRQTSSSVRYYISGGGNTFNGDFTNYNQVFAYNNGNPIAFPGGSNVTLSYTAQAGQYVAMAFTVPANLSTTASGNWGFHATGASGGPATISLSQCPGDFSATLPAGCKGQWNGSENTAVIWESPEVSDPFNQGCRLARGKTYYLNVIQGTLADPATTTCTGTSCGLGLNYSKTSN